MKPDLGLAYLKVDHDRSVTVMFYDVPFQNIDFVEPHAYSVMFDFPYEGIAHALSFDFSDDIFAQLVAQFSPDIRKGIGSSLIGKSFPFSANLPSSVVVPVVECRLGKLQRGPKEEFVPFVITRLGWSESNIKSEH